MSTEASHHALSLFRRHRSLPWADTARHLTIPAAPAKRQTEQTTIRDGRTGPRPPYTGRARSDPQQLSPLVGIVQLRHAPSRRPGFAHSRRKTAPTCELRRGLFEAAAKSTAEKEPLSNPSHRFPAEATLPAAWRIQSPPDTGRRKHHRQCSEELSRSFRSSACCRFGHSPSQPGCPTEFGVRIRRDP